MYVVIKSLKLIIVISLSLYKITSRNSLMSSLQFMSHQSDKRYKSHISLVMEIVDVVYACSFDMGK